VRFLSRDNIGGPRLGGAAWRCVCVCGGGGGGGWGVGGWCWWLRGADVGLIGVVNNGTTPRDLHSDLMRGTAARGGGYWRDLHDAKETRGIE
jgi:hypothetical protein